jgi:iron complex transport system substrate-binding protein
MSAAPCTGRRALILAAASVLPGRALARTSAPRVVCIGGALTEIVYRLGAGDRLVGTDTTSLYPEAAQKTPKVGYARQLSSEGVLSLAPTLIIASADAGPPAALEQLRAAGVALVRGAAGHDLEALLKNVRQVARALDLAQRGEALARELADRWQAVQSRIVRGTEAPRVLFVLSHVANNVQVSGHGTAAHALIEAAGGANAMRGFTGYRPLTAEAVVSAAPQAIVTTAQGVQALGGPERLLAQPGLALTPAGRTRRIFAADGLYLLGAGPRLPDAVQELAQFLGTWA